MQEEIDGLGSKKMKTAMQICNHPITNTFMIHETHCCNKNSFGGKGMATGETMGYVNWLILDYLMESRLHFSQTSGIEELALTTSIGSLIA